MSIWGNYFKEMHNRMEDTIRRAHINEDEADNVRKYYNTYLKEQIECLEHGWCYGGRKDRNLKRWMANQRPRIVAWEILDASEKDSSRPLEGCGAELIMSMLPNTLKGLQNVYDLRRRIFYRAAKAKECGLDLRIFEGVILNDTCSQSDDLGIIARERKLRLEEKPIATDGNRRGLAAANGTTTKGEPPGRTAKRKPRLDISSTMQAFIYAKWREFKKGDAPFEVDGRLRRAGGKRTYGEFLAVCGNEKCGTSGQTINEAIGGDKEALPRVIYNCQRRSQRD